jgi:hypothetical protein
MPYFQRGAPKVILGNVQNIALVSALHPAARTAARWFHNHCKSVGHKSSAVLKSSRAKRLLGQSSVGLKQDEAKWNRHPGTLFLRRTQIAGLQGTAVELSITLLAHTPDDEHGSARALCCPISGPGTVSTHYVLTSGNVRRVANQQSLALEKRLQAGDGAAQYQAMHIIGALIGVHRFQVDHMPHHLEIFGNAIAAVHVAGVACGL